MFWAIVHLRNKIITTVSDLDHSVVDLNETHISDEYNVYFKNYDKTISKNILCLHQIDWHVYSYLYTVV